MGKRKKILYVITKSVWGGAQKYVYDLSTHLPPAEFDGAVITGGGGALVEKLKAAQIRTILLPTLQKSSRFFSVVLAPINILAFFQLVMILGRERPDVLHLSSSKVSGLGAIAAFAYKLLTLNFKPLTVFTVHGWGFAEDRPWLARRAIWLLSWLASIFQDKIITIATADYRAARRFIPQRKLTLIPNGIEPIEFLPAEAARQFLAKATGRQATRRAILIGTIAELARNKGLGYLVDAIYGVKSEIRNRQSEIALIVIGAGEERETLERQIRSLGLGETVFLIGFVPEAKRYLKGFDIFCLPSVKEGLPYSILEAMAAGLPIVASRVGGIPDLIEDQVSGLLVPPKDPRALARAIQTLLVHPGLSPALASAAKERVERHFGLATMIEKTLAVYLQP